MTRATVIPADVFDLLHDVLPVVERQSNYPDAAALAARLRGVLGLPLEDRANAWEWDGEVPEVASNET
jgi:hypothetical protein